MESPEDKDLRLLGSAKNCGDLGPGNTLGLRGDVGCKMETKTCTFSKRLTGPAPPPAATCCINKCRPAASYSGTLILLTGGGKGSSEVNPLTCSTLNEDRIPIQRASRVN